MDCVISKHEVTELRAYKAPPQAIGDSISAAMALIGHSPKDAEDWSVCQAVLWSGTFLRSMQDLNTWALKPKSIQYARKKLAKHSYQQVAGCSLAAAGIYKWANATAYSQ